jgi:hypothetical protein
MHQGACWDFLLDMDTEPRRVPGGYVCDLCPSEPRPVFPNRPALWTDHLFEPFLEWVNESLAKAKWLALYGSPPIDNPRPSMTSKGYGTAFSNQAIPPARSPFRATPREAASPWR